LYPGDWFVSEEVGGELDWKLGTPLSNSKLWPAVRIKCADDFRYDWLDFCGGGSSVKWVKCGGEAQNVGWTKLDFCDDNQVREKLRYMMRIRNGN
jgi:hypothetical protein